MCVWVGVGAAATCAPAPGLYTTCALRVVWLVCWRRRPAKAYARAELYADACGRALLPACAVRVLLLGGCVVVWFIIPCCSITVPDQCAYMLQSVASVRGSAHLDTCVVSMVVRPDWGTRQGELRHLG